MTKDLICRRHYSLPGFQSPARLDVQSSAVCEAVCSSVVMLRRELYALIERHGGVGAVTADSLIKDIESKVGAELSGGTLKECKQRLQVFLSKVRERWRHAHRHEEKFMRENEEWLNGQFDLPVITPLAAAVSAAPRGRPSLGFTEQQREARRMATDRLVTKHTADKLVHAAKRRARSEGRKDLSYILNKATATPTRPAKVRRLLQRPVSLPRAYTREQALALFVDANHTKATWQLTRMSAKEQSANIYPTYREIAAAKRDCYPDGISLQPTRAEVPLQSLVNHTAERIVILQEDVIRQVAGQFIVYGIA